MVWLLLSILFAVLLYVSFRLIGKYNLNEFQVILSNYFVAAILGYFLWDQPFKLIDVVNSSWFTLSIIIGISFVITFYFFTLSTAKAGIAITAVSSKMSVILPVIAGFIYFGDNITIYKIAGIFIALFSFILVLAKGKNFAVKLTIFLLPAVIFLGTGINDTLLKYAHHFLLGNDNTIFITTIFSISFIFSLLYVSFIFILKSRSISVLSLLAGIILGIVNFGGVFFILKSLDHYEASFYFPVSSVSVVLMTSIIAMIVFKEKLSVINWTGIILAIISILLISTT
jgi:drug/metabolite transporter (DMT)-like permease